MVIGGRLALGFDVGTSSVKATALTECGEVFTASSAPYGIDVPFAGAAEQDPEVWWTAVIEAGTALLGKLGAAGITPTPENATIALTGQMHTSVYVGEGGEIVHPAILWSDKRGVEQTRALAAAVPDCVAITGNEPMTAFTVTHLMWLAEHRPDVLAQTRTVLNSKDELRRRLGAGVASELADASATGMLDTRSGVWSDTVLAAAGVDPGLLPAPGPSHAVTGCVTPGWDDASRPLLEALEGIPVVAGGGDQMTQAVALGVTSVGALGLSLGTSGVAFAALAEPQPGSFRHVYDDTWLALDSTHAAGLSMTWISRLFEQEPPVVSAGAIGPADAPLFLPYLAGHRRTEDAAGAPGAFLGLTAGHERGHLAYAVMEGVSIELLRLAESIGAAAGGVVSADVVHVGGGGGRSPVWRQILADVFDRPVAFSDRDSSFGAAYIAAEQAGWSAVFDAQASADEAIAQPDESRRALTAERRDRFSSYASRLREG